MNERAIQDSTEDHSGYSFVANIVPVKCLCTSNARVDVSLHKVCRNVDEEDVDVSQNTR